MGCNNRGEVGGSGNPIFCLPYFDEDGQLCLYAKFCLKVPMWVGGGVFKPVTMLHQPWLGCNNFYRSGIFNLIKLPTLNKVFSETISGMED